MAGSYFDRERGVLVTGHLGPIKEDAPKPPTAYAPHQTNSIARMLTGAAVLATFVLWGMWLLALVWAWHILHWGLSFGEWTLTYFSGAVAACALPAAVHWYETRRVYQDWLVLNGYPASGAAESDEIPNEAPERLSATEVKWHKLCALAVNALHDPRIVHARNGRRYVYVSATGDKIGQEEQMELYEKELGPRKILRKVGGEWQLFNPGWKTADDVIDALLTSLGKRPL